MPEPANLLEAVEALDPSCYKAFDPAGGHLIPRHYRHPFGPIELELVLGCRSRWSRVLTVNVLPFVKTEVAKLSGGWKLCANRGTTSLTAGLRLKFDPDFELTPSVLRDQAGPLGELTDPFVAAALTHQFAKLLAEPHWFEMHTHRLIVRFCDFTGGVELLLRLAEQAQIEPSAALHGLNTHCGTVGDGMLSRFRSFRPDDDDPARRAYDEQRCLYDRMVDACRLVAVPA